MVTELKDKEPPKPEDINVDDIRYDILQGQIRADQLLYGKHKPINAAEIDDQLLLKLEVMKGKMKYTNKMKSDERLVNHSAIVRYVQKHGFYCSQRLPDAINQIIMRLIDEAIGRVYCLPGRMERITVRPSDLPLILR